ncbi:MAG: DNA methyltransferase [Elusimicrobia bacterium GWA2_56_46]|nr:MAG: DNA methyltransferase [Elusimicrobia bacterium GWA2_56_46]OGR55316.1 MAG: DNA methyltransferase [Elusimicrobia bacterium GWC2_56_31]HBW22529.1 DNA methyltransferase [Elusimicrobiota bacterium]
MAQLEHIEAIEKQLWNAADTLRANSNYASNEYFMPVMGLIFLRHAYSRYLGVKDQIIADLPKRGGKPRELTKADFSQKTAIFLRTEAQFDHLVSLPEGADRAKAIIKAMESIESDYKTLEGILPKQDYQEISNEVLGNLLRMMNPDELKTASGDIFGRIYEYFLTQFADQKAHDGGEFFTPVSLVSLISNVLEPKKGIVLDPACGSGGMFVQSAHFVERLKENPSEKLTFYGLEKNATTIRLAKMNLAVHGLQGNIEKAITYYEDPHELLGKSDFVMANPPFNVDEVDAEKVKRDPRLPFGLPGVNQNEKVSNGNYLWISYFYSYLAKNGRAGFVMSSQASSAGRDEAKVRQKLIETGAVDAMVAIRSNFFYTRTVPCELWFLNKAKPAQHKDKVLMLDARNVYRKVTRKIYDFSPEQLNNLLSIVWLYRGEQKRFTDLVAGYMERTLAEASTCIDDAGSSARPIQDYVNNLFQLKNHLESLASDFKKVTTHAEALKEFFDELQIFTADAVVAYKALVLSEKRKWTDVYRKKGDLNSAVKSFSALDNATRDLVKQADLVYKLGIRVYDIAVKDPGKLGIGYSSEARKAADARRTVLVEQLKQVHYFYKQAAWLTERFPEAKLRDVSGLVKLVDKAELEKNDWSLTPGRYVGVAPEIEDESFDFEEVLRDIHVELEGLNAEAATLAAKIKNNFEELGI